MEPHDMLVLHGGDDWLSPDRFDSDMRYAMAIPLADELGWVEEYDDGTKGCISHRGWGGTKQLLEIRHDLMWVPGVEEMWIFGLKLSMASEDERLAEFRWKEVRTPARSSQSSTVVFRVTSAEELLRLESYNFRLMPHTTRIFAFRTLFEKGFARIRLTAETEPVLWGDNLDQINPGVLGLKTKPSQWLYTVVCDDGPFQTGDPIFCFSSDLELTLEKHFAAVADRHALALDGGQLTKQTLTHLIRGRKARTVREWPLVRPLASP